MSHEQWLESAAAYALDAMDAGERDAFETHLSTCAECRLAVQEYREVTGLLVHAAEPVAAPAGLSDRVEQMLAAERSASGASTRQVAPDPRFGRSTFGRGQGYALAAAALLLVAATGMFWRKLSEERNASLVAQQELRHQVAARDSLLANLRGSRVHVVSLAPPSGGGPVARVFWNHELRRFFVTAFSLPPATQGRTYQLWAIAEGKAPVSMGTFESATDGVASLSLPVGSDIEALGVIKLCAVTEEPVGGSAGPTETPRFVGEWRHTD